MKKKTCWVGSGLLVWWTGLLLGVGSFGLGWIKRVRWDEATWWFVHWRCLNEVSLVGWRDLWVVWGRCAYSEGMPWMWLHQLNLIEHWKVRQVLELNKEIFFVREIITSVEYRYISSSMDGYSKHFFKTSQENRSKIAVYTWLDSWVVILFSATLPIVHRSITDKSRMHHAFCTKMLYKPHLKQKHRVTNNLNCRKFEFAPVTQSKYIVMA